MRPLPRRPAPTAARPPRLARPGLGRMSIWPWNTHTIARPTIAPLPGLPAPPVAAPSPRGARARP
eukprot:14517948-Alexandrium_andersonii.AAC.1